MNILKQKRKKRSTWKPCEEEMLLKLWEDKLSLSTRKNKTVLSGIVAQLNAVGFHYSPVEVRNKIHNLTTKYKEEKKRMRVSGSPSGWDLYHRMDAILNEQYSSKLSAEENIEIPISSSTDSDRQEDDSLIESIFKKQKMNSFHEHSFEEFDTNDSIIAKDMLELKDEGKEAIQLQAETFEIDKDHSDSDSQEDDSFIEPIIKKNKLMNSFQKQCLTEFRATNSLIAKDMQELKDEGKEAIKLQAELVEIERERNSILIQFLKVYQGKK